MVGSGFVGRTTDQIQYLITQSFQVLHDEHGATPFKWHFESVLTVLVDELEGMEGYKPEHAAVSLFHRGNAGTIIYRVHRRPLLLDDFAFPCSQTRPWPFANKVRGISMFC